MSTKQPYFDMFVDLLREVYRENRVEFPDAALSPGLPVSVDLQADGIAFVIAYEPVRDEQRLRVYCRFGAVPQDRAAAVLTRLLEVNLILANQRNATLGIDPESGEVIYLFDAFLETITVGSLLEALKLAAEQALRWRTTYFLDADADSGRSGPDAQHFPTFA